jgi:hypothetical protein
VVFVVKTDRVYIYIQSVQHVASIHAIDCDGVGHFAIMAGE